MRFCLALRSFGWILLFLLPDCCNTSKSCSFGLETSETSLEDVNGWIDFQAVIFCLGPSIPIRVIFLFLGLKLIPFSPRSGAMIGSGGGVLGQTPPPATPILIWPVFWTLRTTLRTSAIDPASKRLSFIPPRRLPYPSISLHLVFIPFLASATNSMGHPHPLWPARGDGDGP
mmetsp:Transcript_28053/g.74013  ORF Transcript_28053/g.74013 Transcript_28053/m.74013 type:complete len:172 (-) Transcript_28053:13-528(-)